MEGSTDEEIVQGHTYSQMCTYTYKWILSLHIKGEENDMLILVTLQILSMTAGQIHQQIN